MRLPRRLRRTHEQATAEHGKAMTDLDVKDREIDSLLNVADQLVCDLRVSLSEASASLRGAAGEEQKDDSG